MSEIFFSHPHTLLDNVKHVLDKIGSEKFFSSSDEKVKKAREGFVAYFFTLALKKWTGRDWWLAQYDQAERQYPDFDFFSFANDPNSIRAERVELTEAYPHFKVFEEMMEVVKKKRKKYGNSPLDFSLLIFVNHAKSEEWIQILRERLESNHPFLSIWTIHLRFKKGGKEIGKVVAQRIRPTPELRIEVNTDDPEIHKRQVLPKYLEKIEMDGRKCIIPKSDFIIKFRKAAKRAKPRSS